MDGQSQKAKDIPRFQRSKHSGEPTGHDRNVWIDSGGGGVKTIQRTQLARA
jgi:hypothetical protein